LNRTFARLNGDEAKVCGFGGKISVLRNFGGEGIPPSPHMKKSISFDIGFFILENGT
jgi:hypothetical protein